MASKIEKLGVGGKRAGNIRPEEIKIRRGHNYRDMASEAVRKHIDWLKASIRENGVQEPIDVTISGDDIYLEAGECRLTAAQELRKEGWDGYIPCFEAKGDEQEIYAKGLLDNAGLPPSKMEFGKAAAQLESWGWPIERIATFVPQHLGLNLAKAKRYAKDAIDLHHAPTDVKEAVQKGVGGVKVSESLAVAVTRKNRMQAGDIIRQAASDAKAKGKTEAKRPKGEGKALKAKRTEKEETERCLKLADALADVALDASLVRDEVMRNARAYNRARNR